MAGQGVVALMYHGVGDTPVDGSDTLRYRVRESELAAQIELLERLGTVLDPDHPLTGSGVVLTFDDGDETVVDAVLPRLAARGMKAALFMTTAWIGRRGYLDASGLRALAASGWLIGAHGHTHRFLNLLSPSELDDELSTARKVLSDVVGRAPTHLSFPGGRTSPAVEAAARAHGFTTLWSSRPGLNKAPGRGASLRRTVIRRGMGLDRFGRLCRGEPFIHLADELDMGCRALVKRAVGDERYHALTHRLLGAIGRR
jgi:peptidoglycan/xylan/chitin deacetylase (PgdA/CDA1 family)